MTSNITGDGLPAPHVDGFRWRSTHPTFGMGKKIPAFAGMTGDGALGIIDNIISGHFAFRKFCGLALDLWRRFEILRESRGCRPAPA